MYTYQPMINKADEEYPLFKKKMLSLQIYQLCLK